MVCNDLVWRRLHGFQAKTVPLHGHHTIPTIVVLADRQSDITLDFVSTIHKSHTDVSRRPVVEKSCKSVDILYPSANMAVRVLDVFCQAFHIRCDHRGL